MKACPKCKTTTLAPLTSDRASDVVPPSRCESCRGVWLPHDTVEQHLVPAQIDASAPTPALADSIPGFCPQCRGLLVRARVEAKHPFHLDRCPVCAGIWFDAGEWAAIASTEWLTHIHDLWDPVWRKRARAERAVKRHHDTLKSALGKPAFAKLLAAIDVLREHPMRSLGLSFLIEELRGPDSRGEAPTASAPSGDGRTHRRVGEPTAAKAGGAAGRGKRR